VGVRRTSYEDAGKRENCVALANPGVAAFQAAFCATERFLGFDGQSRAPWVLLDLGLNAVELGLAEP